MDLTTDLISQFVKATSDVTENKQEPILYGTIVKQEQGDYVKLDGSEMLTPVTSTTVIKDKERVTVLIKNHTAIVTGNLTSPSAQNDDLTDANTKISEFETVIAGKVSTEDFDAEKGRIDDLVSDNVLIKESLTVVGDIVTDNIEIKNKLKGHDAEFEDIKTHKLSATDAELKYATIENLEVTDQKVHNLEGDYGKFKEFTTEKFEADDAIIGTLETDKLSVKDAELKYANIDFTNIGKAAMEYFYAQSGLIKDVVIGEATITGNLVGVTIKGENIEAGTIVADKLVIKGTDGLYYKLNTDGIKTEAEQTEYNSLNGDILMAKSIVATKIDVNDLVAFDATIGGFVIGNNNIHSGVKESVNNTTRGIYLDKDGQMAVGDSSNFIKFFKDTDNKYKLRISASEIMFGDASSNIEDTFDDMQDKLDTTIVNVDVEYYLSTSNTTQTGGSWSTNAPIWSNGKYMWSRTKKTYANSTTTTTDPVCIAGAKGTDGGSGIDGKGIKTIVEQYYKSTSNTTQTGGSWVTVYPGWSDGTFVWTRSTITFTDNTTNTTNPICVTGGKGNTGDDGQNGKDGVGVSSVDVQYYLSTSATSLVGGTWSTTAPTWVDGKFLWSKTVTKLTNNTVKESTPVCITGGKGNTGTQGNGIVSVTEEYYLSSSDIEPTGGSWVTTPPTWSIGKFVWTRSKIEYTNAPITYTKPICDSAWKAVDDLEIGGRNLLKNSAISVLNLSSWAKNNATLACVKKDDFDCFIITPSNVTADKGVHGHLDVISDNILVPYRKYSYSFWCKTTAIQDVSHASIMHFQTVNTNGVHHLKNIKFNISSISANVWTYLVCVFEVTEQCYFRPYVWFLKYGQTYHVYGFKLEQGNKPTGWTPAPEDIDNIQLGSRNLCLNTKPYDNISYWTQLNSVALTIVDEATALSKRAICCTLMANQPASSQCGLYNALIRTLTVGNIYSWSLYVKCSKNNIQGIIGQENGGYKAVTLTTEWQLITYTYKAIASSNKAFIIYANAGSNLLTGDKIFAHSLMLVEGNKCGTWCEAPEDVDKSIADASKTATNFMLYDTTNGLQLGNKTGGTWTGFRTQITATAFNILSASGVLLASYGEKLIELGKNATDAIIKLCGGKGQLKYDSKDSYMELYSADNVRVKSDKTASIFSTFWSGVGNTSAYQSAANVSKDSIEIFSSMCENMPASGIGNWMQSSIHIDPGEVTVNADYQLTLASSGIGGVTISAYDSNVNISGNVLKFNGTTIARNNILWSGESDMTTAQVASLDEPISAQQSGIMAVFSNADESGNKNCDWYSQFIPKIMVANHPGVGHGLSIGDPKLSQLNKKKLYISDSKIVGASVNEVKEGDEHYVLRYIVGV